MHDLYCTEHLQIDHLDHPTLPLRDVGQNLYGTAPTQETCPIYIMQIIQLQPGSHVLDHADYTAPTRQHELDHIDRTDQGFICREIFILTVAIDHLLKVCILPIKNNPRNTRCVALLQGGLD